MKNILNTLFNNPVKHKHIHLRATQKNQISETGMNCSTFWRKTEIKKCVIGWNILEIDLRKSK